MLNAVPTSHLSCLTFGRGRLQASKFPPVDDEAILGLSCSLSTFPRGRNLTISAAIDEKLCQWVGSVCMESWSLGSVAVAV